MKSLVRKKSGGTGTKAAANRDARPSPAPTKLGAKRTWLLAIPLALFVVAAFLPARDNGFVDWDDQANFLENPFYRGVGAAQLTWAWSTFWLGVYQPLAWLLFGLQYLGWGLDPRGYHLTSIFLHAANAVVLYALSMAVLARCRTDSSLENPGIDSAAAWIATALFMVHPLRVEAVAWASCQPYLPCALFSMLAVLAYLRSFRAGSDPRWGWLAGSFGLFVAALLSKAVAVSLPVALFILDVYPLRRFNATPGRWFGPSGRRACWEKVPFVIVSLIFMGLAIAAKPQSRASVEDYQASARLAQACHGAWFYIIKTVLPVDLIAFYPAPREIDWLSPPFFLSVVGILATSAGLFLMRRRLPGMLAVWLTYLVILAPNSGLIRISDQIAADRYSYISMLGWVIMAAAGLRWLRNRASPARPSVIASVAVSALALLVLMGMTWGQCRTWHDSEALWTHAIEHSAADNWVAHYNLGLVFSRKGKFEAAEAQFTQSLRLAPGHAKTHNNLGVVLYNQGKLDAAAAHYAEALRLDPAQDEAHNNLGIILYNQGKTADAAAHYAEAIRLNPRFARAHNNLGVVLFDQGRLEEASSHYALALRLDPEYGDAHNNLGEVLSRQGNYAEALAHFEEAERQSPGNVEADRNRAKVMAACPDAKYRDGRRAVALATRACEVTGWKKPEFLDTMAAACAEAGDFDAAVSWQTKAIELLPDERQQDDYRARLRLYQARKPYREAAARPAPVEMHP
jgi:tetratricopeptide (TPR) repeat protein